MHCLCGELLQARQKKFCSARCRLQYTSATCPQCKVVFNIPLHRFKDGRINYCSPACYHLGAKGRPNLRSRTRQNINCFTCKKQFEATPSRLRDNKNVYCSQKCYFKKPKKQPLTFTCVICKIDFQVGAWRLHQGVPQYCSKKCNGIGFRGRLVSIETRRKLSDGQKGEKGWNWQGGKTSWRNEIYNSLDWKLWREAVFERDNYTCQMCGQHGGRLEANHIKKFSDYPDLRFEVSNGITLCKPCHRDKVTWHEVEYEEFFYTKLAITP